MTDDAALLRAILVTPAEDLYRLQYADWLDENGQPERAEFIRVQVELAQAWAGVGGCTCRSAVDKFHCDRCLTWDQTAELAARERELLNRPRYGTHGESNWCGWAQWPYATESGLLVGQPFTFSRGFVAEIRLPLAVFMENAKAIFERHPVERVVLTDREPAEYWVVGRAVVAWERWRNTLEHRSAVPSVLCTGVPLSEMRFGPGGGACWVHDSREAALSALSVACVRHGRYLAGLPA